MKQLRALIFPMILILASLGCDYGPMPDENSDAAEQSFEEWDEYAELEGELKFSAKKKDSTPKNAHFSAADSEESAAFTPAISPQVYGGEVQGLDYLDLEPQYPESKCKCNCTAHNQACELAGCPAGSKAKDKKGTCKQNGTTCGGTCKCHDCYTVLDKKCHSFPAPLVGSCEWH